MPISRLAEAVTETIQDIEDLKLLGPIVGHVGDGNLHVGLLIDMDDGQEFDRVDLNRLAERALRMDGTCTGEHGIGQGKVKYMEAEHGAATIAAMRALKHALDPDSIMNPGKIFTPGG